MLERKTVKYKFKLTAVALANKVARIVPFLAEQACPWFPCCRPRAPDQTPSVRAGMAYHAF
jgi:hypothetical protein